MIASHSKIEVDVENVYAGDFKLVNNYSKDDSAFRLQFIFVLI